MDLDWSIRVRSYADLPRGGDLGLVSPLNDGALAALIDVTGHGLAAYSVAQTARNTILGNTFLQPDKLLEELHSTLWGTVGAAISLARIHYGFLDFVGVGNVRVLVGNRSLAAQPGIVGKRMRTPKLIRATFLRDTWLMMHTDGMSRPKSIPNGNAVTAANSLIDELASDYDDAGVLLLRWRNTV